MSDVVVLEIRGVGGATAEEILGTEVTQLTGDKKAGFFRREEPEEPERHVEAYYWGGLTSGSGTTALWWRSPRTLLLRSPFISFGSPAGKPAQSPIRAR